MRILKCDKEDRRIKASRIIKGLRGAGMDDKIITEFILYIDSGNSEHLRNIEKISKEKSYKDHLNKTV